MPQPQHGQERHRQQVTTFARPVGYTMPDGQVAYSGPSAAHSQPHSERYCATCADWIPLQGFLSHIIAAVGGCPRCGTPWRRAEHDA